MGTDLFVQYNAVYDDNVLMILNYIYMDINLSNIFSFQNVRR